MNLYKSYHYKLGKEQTTGEIFRNSLRVFRESGMVNIPVRFFFSDKVMSRTSAIERLLKQYLELAPYAIEEYSLSGEKVRILSNLDERWAQSNPRGATGYIDTDLLAKIADGIPNPYHLMYSNFMFEKIPWVLGGSIEPMPGKSGGRKWSGLFPEVCLPCLDTPFPGVVLKSKWWTSRRQISLHATIYVESPGLDCISPPASSILTMGYLKQLGKIHLEGMVFGLDDDEWQMITEATDKANRISEECRTHLPEILGKLQLPHILPGDPGRWEGSWLTSPHKEVLVSVFKPRQYRYQSKLSGQGVFILSKHTPNHNRLSLLFDVGSISHLCSSRIAINGPGWSSGIDLIVTPDQKHSQYPIGGGDSWNCIVQNVAVLVDNLEKEYVPQIETLFPRTPKWFTSL